MFYGIDLSKDSFKTARLGTGNDDLLMISCPLVGEAFERFKAHLRPDDYVAVEASTNSFWFIDQIKPHVANCFVLDPYKLSIIYRSSKKTDSSDAQKIAHKLKYYVQYDQSGSEFPKIYIPSKNIQELRSMLSTCNTLKKELVMTKNRIRSLLTQNGFFGLKHKDISLRKHQTEILALLLPVSVHVQLEILIDLLNAQEDSLKKMREAAIAHSAPYRREIEILTSIKGISPYVAVVLLADIGDVSRFKNAKHFCSYLRAAPKIDSSGDSTKIGKVNKHSRHHSLTVLVECISHFRSSSVKLNTFYEKKAKGKSAGKVRIALVRKVLVAIYYMLSRNMYFYDREKENHERKMLEYEKIIDRAA